MLTLKKAAEQTGKSKQAIQQAIKKGKISAKKNENGEWAIDPSELFRVYAPVIQVGDKKDAELDDALQFTIKRLELESELKDEKIRMAQKRNDELEKERDEWREQAKRLSLPHEVHSNKAEIKPAQRPWWHFGRTIPENN